MIILVDDRRDGDGIICRDIDAAQLVLAALQHLPNADDNPIELRLDHDLGQGQGRDGIDLLVWARDNNIRLPEKIVLVSENPVGCRNMANLLIYDLLYSADASHRYFVRTLENP